MVSSQLPDMTAQNRGPAPQSSTLALRLRDPERLSTHATARVLPTSPTAMDTSQPTTRTMSTAKRLNISYYPSRSLRNAHSAHHAPQLTSLALRPRVPEQTIAQTPSFETSLTLRPRLSEQHTAARLRPGIESQATASVLVHPPFRDSQATAPKGRLSIVSKDSQSFKTLTPELKLRVMSFLPLGDIRALRQTSQEFLKTISASEDKLARPFIAHHLNRLQTSIDAINAAKMPTSVETFLASMSLWTSIGGSFLNRHLSLESWYLWFSHLSNSDVRNPELEELRQVFEQWAHVARVATLLQRQINIVNHATLDLWE